MNYSRFGTTFTNAYYHLHTLQTTKDQGYTAVVHIYFSELAKTSGAEAISTVNHQIAYTEDLSGQSFANPLAFGYALLKTLPEYASATNV